MGTPIKVRGLTESAGTQMKIRALDGEMLNPIIDGERFESLRELLVEQGPQIRIPRFGAPPRWVS
jgi:hypothetical protein